MTWTFKREPIEVHNDDDWSLTEPLFQQGLERLPIMSVDTERTLGTEKLRAVVIGVVTGIVWIIAIPELEREKGGASGLDKLLPPRVLQALEDSDICKVGSNIAGDVIKDWRKHNINLRCVLDTMKSMSDSQARTQLFLNDPYPAWKGLDHVCYLLFGMKNQT